MDDLGSGLRLHRINAPLEKCKELVDLILGSGKLEIEGIEVTYALHPNPRCRWSYREESPLSDASDRSPFRHHSAEIIEYWSSSQIFVTAGWKSSIHPRTLWRLVSCV